MSMFGVRMQGAQTFSSVDMVSFTAPPVHGKHPGFPIAPTALEPVQSDVVKKLSSLLMQSNLNERYKLGPTVKKSFGMNSDDVFQQ